MGEFLEHCHGHEDSDAETDPLAGLWWQHEAQEDHTSDQSAWQQQAHDVVVEPSVQGQGYLDHAIWLLATVVLVLKER